MIMVDRQQKLHYAINNLQSTLVDLEGIFADVVCH